MTRKKNALAGARSCMIALRRPQKGENRAIPYELCRSQRHAQFGSTVVQHPVDSAKNNFYASEQLGDI